MVKKSDNAQRTHHGVCVICRTGKLVCRCKPEPVVGFLLLITWELLANPISLMKKLHIALLVTFFVIPSISLASIDTNLKYGSRGLDVTELQDFLIDKGFLTGQSSGNFFSLTRRAVVAYQASVGLPATGFVGPMTRTKINDDLSTANAPAVSAEVSETGATATRANTSSNVATPIQPNRGLTQSLASGCSSTVGFSTTTGSSCSSTVASIVALIATNKTVTFPNGAIAEMDSIGNIVRWIKEPSVILQTSNKSSTESSVPVIIQPYTPIATSESISVPPVVPESNAIVAYSDYNFNYHWELSASANTLSCPMTSRNIVIKKAVFKIPDSALQKINELKGLEVDGFKVNVNALPSFETHIGSKSQSYSLEEVSPNTFVYFGNSVPVCGDGGTVTTPATIIGSLMDISQGRNVKVYLEQKGIVIDVNSTSNGVIFDLHSLPVPIMTEWEVWDNTTGKPVKIN